MKTIKDAVTDEPVVKNAVPWSPWLAVVLVVVIYFLSQIFGGLLISIYPAFKHWNSAQANAWVQNSVPGQFVYVLLAEGFTIAAIVAFVRHYKVSLKVIGLRRPRWSDPLYGLAAVVPYFILYFLTVGVVSHFVPSLNVNQQQDIGFSSVHGVAQLVLTGISLVILPPLTEEIMIRGYLYTSLKKGLPRYGAVMVTSLIFASAHLPEGGAAGPLYIAALDTFVLSLVLIFLREVTDGLYSSMTLHAIKNGIAFVALYILHTH